MAQTRWLVLASFYLDTGTEHFASARVKHPSYIYEGYALRWGSIEKSIPVPSGLPHISEAHIRLADTVRHWRDLLAHQTPRRRMIDLRLVQEGTSVAAGHLVFSGEVVNADFGPGYIDLTLRDRTFAWLDEPIPAMLIKELYPDIPDKNEGGFLNIICGEMHSPETSPPTATGVIPCPHFGLVQIGSPATTTVDRYGLAMHPVANVAAVYRRVSHLNADSLTPSSEWEVVDPSEYTVREVEITAFNVEMDHTFIDFILDQAGAEIHADVDGIDRRGAWGSLAAEGPFSPPVALRNPIDFFINVTFFLLHKAGVSVEVFDTDEIAALRTTFETMIGSPPTPYLCDGAITEPMTGREFLGRFLPSFNLDMLTKVSGKITLNFTDEADPDRPVFSEGRLIVRKSFFERLPDPIANQIVYKYQENPAERSFFTWGVYDDTAAQNILGYDDGSPVARVPRIEKEELLLYFVRDASVAADVVERRAQFIDAGSYRQEFQLPAPPVLDDVELARLVGITHSQGLETGGYTNREAKIVSMRLDLDLLLFTLGTILREPQAISGPSSEYFRPATSEEWEDPAFVNPTRSHIDGGALSIDADADPGESLTSADIVLDGPTNSIAQYAQLFNYGCPEPDPLRTLVTVEIYVDLSFDLGGNTNAPLGRVDIFNAITHATAGINFETPFVHTLFASSGVSVGRTTYRRVFTVSEFALYFGSLASNIKIRSHNYHTLLFTFSPAVHLYIYDVYGRYTYSDS